MENDKLLVIDTDNCIFSILLDKHQEYMDISTITLIDTYIGNYSGVINFGIGANKQPMTVLVDWTTVDKIHWCNENDIEITWIVGLHRIFARLSKSDRLLYDLKWNKK